MRNFTTQATIQASWTFGMPVIDRVRTAPVRLLPTHVVRLAAPFGLGSQDTTVRTAVEGTAVCTYSRDIDAVAVKGAFPGTSAWSPPI
jgi:hypothetical protein